MSAAQLINQTSGEVEFYTPPNIITAARFALGGRIMLDPASSEAANRTVGAARIFTREDDALSKVWQAETVWMNHPFHKGWKACDEHCKRKTCVEVNKKTGKARGHIYHDIPSNEDWLRKLLNEFAKGNVRRACCITFASTSEGWFRPLLDFPQCYLSPRTNYMLPDGEVYHGVTKGSVVTYLGGDVELFRRGFEGAGLGRVKI